MAQQTAMEWLYQRILANDIESVYQQAKEMEKQQIMEAYDYGDIGWVKAELYYTETYGK
jgi:hypothetical protein